MNVIYILCAPEAYETASAQGTYKSDSLDTEGFIHASPAEQLTRVANKYYREHPALKLLTVDADRVSVPVKWEAISNGDLYPHLYGPLNLDAVTQVETINRQTDGSYQITPA